MYEVLKFKHWHLFLLIVGGFIFSFVVIMIYQLSTSPDSNVTKPIVFVIVSRVLFWGAQLIYWFWLWRLGDLLRHKSKSNYLYRVLLLIALVKIGVISVYGDAIGHFWFTLLTLFLFIVIVLSFVDIAIKFSKTFQTSSGLAFVYIWLFPIGIWFLQPQVNRLNMPPDST